MFTKLIIMFINRRIPELINKCDFKMVRKCIILKHTKSFLNTNEGVLSIGTVCSWICDETVALGRSEGLVEEPSHVDVAKIHNRPAHIFRFAVTRVWLDDQPVHPCVKNSFRAPVEVVSPRNQPFLTPP